MSMMIAMDLQAALIAHLHWKSRLADFFYGLEDIKESDVSDHTNCEFGKWFYARGKNELADWPEKDDLEQLHQEVHQYIRELVIMPEEIRHSLEGRQQLARFQTTCDRLVELLEAMVKKAHLRHAYLLRTSS